ncbi:MAG: calcium-binding protein, partial [Methylovulum sp.]|nr:calcium-binding protein [Methylovulum sp.]
DATDVITDKGLSTDVDTVIMPYQLSKYTLPTGIEQGTISAGTQASSLTGNDSDNTLTGNDGANALVGAVGRDSLFGGLGDDALNGGSGDDVLEGGVGNNNLTGGTGSDSFVFDAALKASVDNITDFKPIDDTIKLENQIFTKLTVPGVLDASQFVKGQNALDPNDVVIYNPTTGTVTYDSDGSGAGFGIQIAMLGVNLAITNADFSVI